MSRKFPAGAPLILFLLSLLIAAARFRTLHEPLERDITTYAVIGHEMLQGRPLYTDLWDNKPPLLYLTYAAAEKIAGYGERQIYFVNVLFSVLILMGVFRVIRALGGDTTAALWGAAAWAVISGSLVFEANQPAAELMINACWVWALGFMVEGRRLALAGTLLGAAILVKPVAGFLALGLIGTFGIRFGFRPRSFARLLFPIFALIGLTLLWFAVQHRLRDFVNAVWVFNRFYAEGLSGWTDRGIMALVVAFRRGMGLYHALLGLIFLAALFLAGRRGEKTALYWLAGTAAGVFLAIASPGFPRPHYYQLGLPLLAASFGWLMGRVPRPALTGAVVLAGLLALEIPSYALSPDEWSLWKYRDSIFIESRAAAEKINRYLNPGETFYHYGSETGLYFYSRRRPPSGVMFHYPLLDGPLADELSDRVIRDLNRVSPAMVVITKRGPMVGGKAAARVREWIRDRYEVHSTISWGEFLYLRRIKTRHG